MAQAAQVMKTGGLSSPRSCPRPLSCPPPPPPPPPPASTSNTTRLLAAVRDTPRALDRYFTVSFLRQVAWSFISFGLGFYVAGTVSLTFGALAINDVIAAVIVVFFTELTSYVCYTSEQWDYRLLFWNWFKIGMQVALMADAFKLGG